MLTANEIARKLDAYLDVASFEDASQNGLQVDRRGPVEHICCGVDASVAFFEEAHERGADMVIVHHGLSWGGGIKRLTSVTYERISTLMRYNMAVYASHLPLDAHPVVGNNTQICDALGLIDREPFGRYGGRDIGFAGTLPEAVTLEKLKRDICEKLCCDLRAMDFGPDMVQTIGVVSGGAADDIQEAGEKHLDVFLTGEPKLVAYHLAQELQVNAVFAGHYATEVFGVRALAGWLTSEMGVEAEFVDMGVPF